MNTRSQPNSPGRIVAGVALALALVLALLGAAATTAPTAHAGTPGSIKTSPPYD